MRKIYFIIFGIALAVLILLVDWREKFNAIVGKKSPPETSLDLLQPVASAESGSANDSSLAAALDKELDETMAAAGSEADGEQNPQLPPPLPAVQRPQMPFAGNGLARSNVGRGLAAPPPGLRQRGETSPRFQDVPEQPYLDESRQLLRQMRRNYGRIISANPQNPSPERQP